MTRKKNKYILFILFLFSVIPFLLLITKLSKITANLVSASICLFYLYIMIGGNDFYFLKRSRKLVNDNPDIRKIYNWKYLVLVLVIVDVCYHLFVLYPVLWNIMWIPLSGLGLIYLGYYKKGFLYLFIELLIRGIIYIPYMILFRTTMYSDWICLFLCIIVCFEWSWLGYQYFETVFLFNKKNEDLT